MPRDASGNYTLPAGNPVVAGTTITATWANSTMPDIGAEITDSLSRSGQGGMLVPFRLADGTSLEPAFAFTSELSLGMYRIGTAHLGFAGGGALMASMSPAMDQPLDIWTNGKLKGYANDGLQASFSGDLDTIVVNSTYAIHPANVTNEPADMSNWSFIHTYSQSAVRHTQVIYSLFDEWKQWMRSNEDGVWTAWNLVVDGGSFSERLAGYEDDGEHVEYTGDLNLITVNSLYFITMNSVTNGPVGVTSDTAYIQTMLRDSDINIRTVQIIYGAHGSNAWKMWMREQEDLVWSAWKLVVDGGAFSLRLAGYADTGLHDQYTGDLNVVNVNSTYFVFNNGGITNHPADFQSLGFLTTYIRGDTGEQTQVLIGQNVDYWMQWMRHNVTGTWTAWKLVVDGNNLGFDGSGITVIDAATPTFRLMVGSAEVARLQGNVGEWMDFRVGAAGTLIARVDPTFGLQNFFNTGDPQASNSFVDKAYVDSFHPQNSLYLSLLAQSGVNFVSSSTTDVELTNMSGSFTRKSASGKVWLDFSAATSLSVTGGLVYFNVYRDGVQVRGFSNGHQSVGNHIQAGGSIFRDDACPVGVAVTYSLRGRVSSATGTWYADINVSDCVLRVWEEL